MAKVWGLFENFVRELPTAIIVLAFHIGDFCQYPVELSTIEELGTGLDVLAAGQPIRQDCGHELFNRDAVFGCKLSGALVPPVRLHSCSYPLSFYCPQ
jgi:hypothetical protein